MCRCVYIYIYMCIYIYIYIHNPKVGLVTPPRCWISKPHPTLERDLANLASFASLAGYEPPLPIVLHLRPATEPLGGCPHADSKCCKFVQQPYNMLIRKEKGYLDSPSSTTTDPEPRYLFRKLSEGCSYMRTPYAQLERMKHTFRMATYMLVFGCNCFPPFHSWLAVLLCFNLALQL